MPSNKINENDKNLTKWLNFDYFFQTKEIYFSWQKKHIFLCKFSVVIFMLNFIVLFTVCCQFEISFSFLLLCSIFYNDKLCRSLHFQYNWGFLLLLLHNHKLIKYENCVFVWKQIHFFSFCRPNEETEKNQIWRRRRRSDCTESCKNGLCIRSLDSAVLRSQQFSWRKMEKKLKKGSQKSMFSYVCMLNIWISFFLSDSVCCYFHRSVANQTVAGIFFRLFQFVFFLFFNLKRWLLY